MKIDKLVDDKGRVWVPFEIYEDALERATELQQELDRLHLQVPLTYGEASCDCE